MGTHRAKKKLLSIKSKHEPFTPFILFEQRSIDFPSKFDLNISCILIYGIEFEEYNTSNVFQHDMVLFHFNEIEDAFDKNVHISLSRFILLS